METVIAFVAALTTVLGGVAALRDKQPVKWIFERLVSQPLESALDRKIDERIEPTSRRVSLMYAEMHPNGGSSLRDAVNRTETKVGGVAVKVDQLDDKVDKIDIRVGRVEGAVDVLSHSR